MRPVEHVLEKLGVVTGPDGKGEYLSSCPSHDDRNTPNLRVGVAGDGRVLLHCFAGCDQQSVLAALEERGISRADLFANRDGNASARRSCTLKEYAEAKRLPVSFLEDLGISEMSYAGVAALRIPYFGPDGGERAVRFRLALHKGPERNGRFRWKSGSKTLPYGLWRLERAREAGYVVLVEGESDCDTLWHHGVHALGIPGASNWKKERSGCLDGIEKVYAVIEPDGGGEAFEQRLASSTAIRDRLRLVELEWFEDVNEIHRADPEQFKENLRAAFGRAKRWADQIRSEEESRLREAWEACEALAGKRRILDAFADTLRRSGVAGESRVAKLLYLALTSRLLEKPVSIAVKGPSSGGKSYLTESVPRFFPEGAYHALTAMSERTLAYSEEPIKHRFLVFFEADGLASDFATYLIRSLLSEGRVRYETVESTKDGIRPRLIEREGPTGLIVTTTAVKLHPENETRLLSLTVADTQEQTRDVLAAIAKEHSGSTDLGPWHALQEWLSSTAAECRVTIPYAETLAELVPPVAVRLGRDFGAVLSLIRTHALLHQATRERDGEGKERKSHAREREGRLDFDTTSNGNERGSRRGGFPNFSTGTGQDQVVGTGSPGPEGKGFKIPASLRKAALVYLALAAWHAGEFDPRALGEVRGREVDEAGLKRALYRSSMGEIEHLLGLIVKDKLVVVERRLAGTGRTAIERLGAEVEELRSEDEKRYIDMTPAIFVFAAVAMAIRYISLGLDDQDLYILAGILFALMYGLRPFFFKMQRPRDD